MPLVDFLAEFLGEHAEIVLHDLSDLEHSIIHIRNGHISGRSVEDPTTDLVVRQLQEHGGTDFHSNYPGLSRDNKKLKCSSFFIRDQERKLVGVLCINLQIDQYLQAQKYLDSILLGMADSGLVLKETLGQSVDEMIDGSIQNAFSTCGCDGSQMNHVEKLKIIELIDSDGIFRLKGAVGKVALKLGISEPTVYRYLNKISASRL